MISWQDTDVLLIVNPLAGGWRGQRSVAKVIRAARSKFPRLDVLFTGKPSNGREYAIKAVAEGFGAVLCAGGDGTINEVINGLAGSRVPLGIIPIGTANVLARELGMPADTEHVVTSLLCGAVQRIPLGKAGERRFILMAGVGFDAYIIGRVHAGLKRLSGTLAYGVAGAEALFRYPYPNFSVRIDGDLTQATSCIISKVRRYAGDFIFAPEASLQDPIFHVRIFQGSGPRVYAGHAVKVLSGATAIGGKAIALTAERVEISSEDPVSVQVDGELIGPLPMTFSIERDALDLIFPAAPGQT